MIIKKLKSNKGFAIELAIFAGLVLFAISSLLFIATLRQTLRDNVSNQQMNEPALIEQYGESFYEDVISDNSISTLDKEEIVIANNTYYESITIDSNLYELEIFKKNEDGTYEVVLNVIVNKTSHKIIKWYFDNPLNDIDYIEEYIVYEQ